MKPTLLILSACCLLSALAPQAAYARGLKGLPVYKEEKAKSRPAKPMAAAKPAPASKPRIEMPPAQETALMGGALKEPYIKASPRQVRVQTARATLSPEAMAALSPASGSSPNALPETQRLSLLLDLPSKTEWKPYVGGGAGIATTTPGLRTQTPEYHLMAGVSTKSDPDKKGRSHQFSLGYTFTDIANGGVDQSAASGMPMPREQSHGVGAKWKLNF